MPIERPDWGPGGENRSMVTKSPTAEIDAGLLNNGMTAAELATIRNGTVARPDWRATAEAEIDRQIVALPSLSDSELAELRSGLPAINVAEMKNSADGFDAQLGSMQVTAGNIVAEYGNGIVSHFDTLSPALQVKAYRLMMRNPGASLPDLLDKIEPTLTLDEAAEATQWVRKLKEMRA